MGGGTWSNVAYTSSATARAAAGVSDFDYHAKVRSGVVATKVADELNVFDKKRESRDGDEHPNSTPIVIFFDVTGSMGGVPKTMQKRLPELFGLLLREGYVDDPQIMTGGVGDATCDRVPVQISQFESDNRIDDQLRLLYLEGGGGGQKTESYELFAWYVANRVETDAWDKRNKKGHMFIIGDEKNYPNVKATHLAKHFGLGEDVSTADVYRQLQERWNVYFILPNLTFYYNDLDILDHWRGLLGQNVLRLEDPDAVCDLIATTIGLEEEAISLSEGVDALDDKYRGSVSRALAHYSGGPVSKGGTAVLDVDVDLS